MTTTNTPCEKLLASLNTSVDVTMHNGKVFSGKLLYTDDTNVILSSKSSYILNEEDPIFNVSVLTKKEIASFRFSVEKSVLKEHLNTPLNQDDDDEEDKCNKKE